MENYSFLLCIAIILITTKLMGIISEKVNMPQVVGALIAGIILGPSVLNIVSSTDFLEKNAEIGVILLMFMAGIDTDTRELKRNGIAYVFIALLGVILPIIGGFVTYYMFFDVNMADKNEVLKAVFMGVILTATSVSITVEALRELGHLNGRIGNAIVGAAVIDDIVGIIILTFVISLKKPSIHISTVIIKIILYVVIIAFLGWMFYKKREIVDSCGDKRRIAIYVFAVVLIVSYVSETYFGIADITGAYIVGMCLSTCNMKHEIARKMNVASYIFFAPIFFASIGMEAKLVGMRPGLIAFSVVVLIVAILTKVIGCGIGAKLFKYSWAEALNIGIGMVSRGEVALIVAQKGYKLGLLDSELFSPIVIIVIVTTVLTPVMLKLSIKRIEKPA